MGREVRMVPADWVHPTYKDVKDEFDDMRIRFPDRYVPLYEATEEAMSELEAEATRFIERYTLWQMGLYEDGKEIKEEHRYYSFEDYYGSYLPCRSNYMPRWEESEKTHYMMYEDTSEGTPISPAFETPEELATWLAENKASSFADFTAVYDACLNVINSKHGSLGMVMHSDGTKECGVEAMNRND